jgi:hypothetical protein
MPFLSNQLSHNYAKPAIFSLKRQSKVYRPIAKIATLLKTIGFAWFVIEWAAVAIRTQMLSNTFGKPGTSSPWIWKLKGFGTIFPTASPIG